MKSYEDIQPIDSPIPADRQGAKRHYGVHPYFTRRPYNVVKKYILQYSYEGDLILDPFGGSGVTPIEAFLENRVGIQNDINPLANFITRGLADLLYGNISSYQRALAVLQEKCEVTLAEVAVMNEPKLSRLIDTLPLPPNIPLPRNSDVEKYFDLFLPQQLASLALLRKAIDSLSDRYSRKAMLLAWSATLTKLNKTFLSTEGRLESRGGSSIFSIYRFKVAKRPVSLPAWKTFHERAMNVMEAKEEIDKAIELKRRTVGWHGRLEIYQKDIDELEDQFKGKVDYIFTDPPYGGHISYLDLSLLWNNWLGHLPAKRARERELIVGGDLNLTEAKYVERLGKSICTCAKMLKPGRWMSIVFQHWNVAYFNAILESASSSGMELREAISQVGDPIWSMHKKKGSESVLAGEMILTFYRNGEKRKTNKRSSFDVRRAVGKILDSVKSNYVYGEYLFNRVVVEAWHEGAIEALDITRAGFADLIREHGWLYDKEYHRWTRAGGSTELPFS